MPAPEERVVDAVKERIFKTDTAACLREILPAGRNQFVQRIFFIDRHQLIAQFIIGGVERDRQPDLQLFPAETFIPGIKPAVEMVMLRALRPKPSVAFSISIACQTALIIGQRFAHPIRRCCLSSPLPFHCFCPATGGQNIKPGR